MRNRFPRVFLTIVVQNVPLRMIGSSMATGYDVIKRHVIGSEHVRMRNQKLRNIHISGGLFTGSDVIKRHVNPKGFPWKGGKRACATRSKEFLPISLLTEMTL